MFLGVFATSFTLALKFFILKNCLLNVATDGKLNKTKSRMWKISAHFGEQKIVCYVVFPY